MYKKNKILFLDVKDEKEFYNIQRNLYPNIESRFIFSSNSKITKILKRICLKLNLDVIEYFFGNWKKNLNDYDIVIVTDSIYNNLICKYLSENFNGRIVMWYWNPVVAAFNPNKIESKDCELWSFDKDDCETYGMKYNTTYYFDTIKLPNESIENDIYFIGSDKGRLEKLIELEEIFNKNNLKTEFHITKSKFSNNQYKFKNLISYEEVLDRISKSKAILDYVQEGQSGLTQRPMEAIFHRKKLITNDKNIINYDFYNKNNIFIIGYDDINYIYEFINMPYIEISQEILDKYNFSNWIDRISG